jgi:hypothetical protein
MLFQWATLDEFPGMAKVAALEELGWVRTGRHPFYSNTVLMERAVASEPAGSPAPGPPSRHPAASPPPPAP